MDLDSEFPTERDEEGLGETPGRPLEMARFAGFPVPSATRRRASGEAHTGRSETGDALDGYIRSLRGPGS